MWASLSPPWREFLAELDSLLDESLEFHCIGGFAAVAAYGLPRSTNDLDYFTMVPSDRTGKLERLAGEGSRLARKHKVHMHHTGVASVPENYEERMAELYHGHFKNIKLFILDPYDLVLSKISRNAERDREDVGYLTRTQHLHPNVLRERYEHELKPYVIGPPERTENTLKFWIEAYFSRE